MTIQKFTLLYAAALLAMVPARAQVPVKDPVITIVPTKPVPPLPTLMFPTDPPRVVQHRYPQMPMETQKRILPPPEYDHDYNGELTILRTLEPVVYRACRSVIKPGHSPLGCAQRTGPKSCTIWIVTDQELKERGWDYEMVFRHERGHCNSWRHD
jgi:hypothetical protein